MKYLLLIPVVSLAWIHSALSVVEPGDPAPDFSLKDSRDNPQKLSSYAGKFVVLEWMNPECPFVKKHYGSGNMQKLQKQYTGKGVVWFSIISSAPGKQGYCTGPQAEANRKDQKADPTAVLLDPSGEIGQKYGAKTTPHIFIINPEGKVIYGGDSIRSTNPADCSKADNYVRETLDAALAGKPVPHPETKPYGCSIKY